MTSPQEALQRLRRGNERYVEGRHRLVRRSDAERREGLAAGQSPFAVVLSCSDSRTPPEILFDAGLGELFVIRVAGNVATPTQIASAEFAVAQLGARLIIVLGHSGCGAVDAALRDLDGTGAELTPNLRILVDCIAPALAPLVTAEPGAPDLEARAVRANVGTAAAALVEGSQVLAERAGGDELRVVQAVYDLESGRVDFDLEPAD